MGGHKGGEVASALTVASLEAFVLNVLGRFSNLKATEEERVTEDFRAAFEKAHARIFEETGLHPEIAGMGTTLTVAFASRGKLFVVHAGDSRCYLFRAGRLQQLTTDHTIVGELIRRGVVKPEDAAHHIYRHVVTNAVGGSHQSISTEIQRLDLQPADVLLLCSDGLTDMLPDDRIAAVLRSEPDPQVACDTLVNAALEAGGRDNITAIVAVFAALGE
jgi:protein phosphatase